MAWPRDEGVLCHAIDALTDFVALMLDFVAISMVAQFFQYDDSLLACALEVRRRDYVGRERIGLFVSAYDLEVRRRDARRGCIAHRAGKTWPDRVHNRLILSEG